MQKIAIIVLTRKKYCECRTDDFIKFVCKISYLRTHTHKEKKRKRNDLCIMNDALRLEKRRKHL